MLDWIIRGGTLLDGSGRDGVAADLGIRDGKIAAIGGLRDAEAVNVLDARGMTVTPGFLDIHRHGDLAPFRPGFGELELRQGLTTIVNGNCGMSVAPFGAAWRGEIEEYLAPVTGPNGGVPSETMRAYLDALGRQRLPLHVGTLVGGGILRSDLVGHADRALTDDEYRRLYAAMERALADGALGVSLGLGYAPECFYDTEGLIRALAPLAGGALAAVVYKFLDGKKA